MSPLLQVGLRSGIAAIMMAALVFLRGEQAWLRAELWRPGLLVGVLFSLEFVFVGQGLRFTSASHIAIFLYTAPISAALGLHLVNPDERFGGLQWLGIALAFGGVILSFSGGSGGYSGGDAFWGDLLGIAAGAAYGATTVCVRGSKLSEVPATVTLLYQLIGAFILAGGMALLLGQTAHHATPALLVSLAYQAIVVAGFSYLAWFVLLRRPGHPVVYDASIRRGRRRTRSWRPSGHGVYPRRDCHHGRNFARQR